MANSSYAVICNPHIKFSSKSSGTISVPTEKSADLGTGESDIPEETTKKYTAKSCVVGDDLDVSITEGSVVVTPCEVVIVHFDDKSGNQQINTRSVDVHRDGECSVRNKTRKAMDYCYRTMMKDTAAGGGVGIVARVGGAAGGGGGVVKGWRSGGIKAAETEGGAVTSELDVLEAGCATDFTVNNLATQMERVSADPVLYGSSPYISSENDWEEEASPSDTDAHHSDSSDDDNPKSQVDRWIDCEAIQFMDGENSNLSSETEDDSDSDSDITDVSPLVSTGASPLCGLSPAMSRRNLPSAYSRPPPFMRHYSHHGHDGDVEDEEEDDHWGVHGDLLSNHQHHHGHHHDGSVDHHHHNGNGRGGLCDSDNMALVMKALLKLTTKEVDSDEHDKDDDENNKNNGHFTHMMKRHHNNHHHSHHPHHNSHPHHNTHPHHQLSPAIEANPHHRHLRKHSSHHHHQNRRKNMSFTNEEVRLINRQNHAIIDKLIAVENRPNPINRQPQYNSKPSTASINRKKQEEGIRRENIAILRRLQEAKPSKAISSAVKSNTNSSNRHQYQKSCRHSAAASATSQHHHHHHHHHAAKQTTL